MPYLIMTKSYDYDDQFYYEQDGGYPERVFPDEQHVKAVETLNSYRQAEWPSCTPLDIYYQEHTLADLSSSGLESDDLAKGINAALKKRLTKEEILQTDFQTHPLTDAQRYLIGLMLDKVGHSYLVWVLADEDA